MSQATCLFRYLCQASSDSMVDKHWLGIVREYTQPHGQHITEHNGCLLPYRVGSANLLPRKIRHAHDNSMDSENVAGACEPNVHAHFAFRFENGRGNKWRTRMEPCGPPVSKILLPPYRAPRLPCVLAGHKTSAPCVIDAYVALLSWLLVLVVFFPIGSSAWQCFV